MGACRQSYKISHIWEWGGKTYEQKFKSIFNLFKEIVVRKWSRDMFIIDNIKQPFYKSIGCKIFGHKFRYDQDDDTYICIKCWYRMNKEKYYSDIRRKKILKIKSKI
jgi:hypothetical protein